MDITLVTSSMNDLVHGTSNDKKTGCGINLLKAENITRYRRSSRMTDLKEITCEKCKERLAKEIIRSDKKEMTKLLKEEKQRQKMGLGDEGIVPLGNTTAKITKAPAAAKEEPNFRASIPEGPKKPAFVPEKQNFFGDQPSPVVPENNFQTQPQVQPAAPVQAQSPLPQTVPGTNVPLDDTLSQFAINAPSQEPAPAPAQKDDDFLAQFAVQKPRGTETNYGNNTQNDFLAQFAIPAQAPAEAPQEPQNQYGIPQQVPQGNDIMNMFSIGGGAPAQNQYGAQEQYNAAPAAPAYGSTGTPVAPAAPAAPIYNEKPVSGEWDSTANQFFGFSGVAETTVPVAPTADITDPDAPAAMAELGAAPTETIAPVEPPKPPVIDDIAAAAATAASVLGGYNSVASAPAAPAPAAPVIEDLTAPVAPAVPEAPAAEPVIASAPADMISLDDLIAGVSAPAAPAPVRAAAPVQPEPVAPAPAPVQSAAPVQPAAAPAPAPVQSAAPAQPAYTAPKPAAPAPQTASRIPKVPYKKNAAPSIEGQILSVPQFAGLDEFNKPVYTYIQMQIVGYDDNGQPKLAPLPGEKMPVPPQYAGQVVQEEEEVDILSIPPSEMTVGQRIAAAALAKGPAPVTANISKIATHDHSKSTAQSFINAISVSKDYANQSLTDTQGLHARTKIIGSVEDVLAEMGDNSEVIKKQQSAAAAAVSNQIQTTTPNYQEFRPTTRTVSKSNSRPSSGSFTTMAAFDDMPLTKAEMKARKKQEKIDAKFKKEMAKRGL